MAICDRNRRLIRKVGFVTSILLVISGAPGTADTVEDCIQKRDPKLRVTACSDLISNGGQAGQNLAWAHTNRGSVLSHVGRPELAIQDFNRALELDPNYAPAYHNRGLALWSLGRHRRAIEDYTAAIELDPRAVPSFSNRALAHSALGQHDLALVDHTEALRLDPGDPYTLLNRGATYSYLKDYGLALADFDAAIALDPMNARAHNNRAWALYMTDRAADGLPSAERAIEIDPRIGHDTLGHILTRLDRIAEARGSFESAMDQQGARKVRQIQQSLARHGFFEGTPNGTYDAATRGALEACLAERCRLIE